MTPETLSPTPPASATPEPPSPTPSPEMPSPTVIPTPMPGVLYVDATQSLGSISPLVYGTNTGPWQNLTPSQMPYVEAGGFTLLRFSGGNWGDEYLLSRQQLDDFIALCRRLGAEPLVHVKLLNTGPEDAAEWVSYANVERGYAIHYWSIGNEPSLYERNRHQEGYDTETFNRQWREFALAMKAVDPGILLVGPEIHQYTPAPWDNPKDSHGKDWMEEFLRANGDLVDVVSFHRYPFGYTDPLVSELLASSAEWDRLIPKLRSLIYETTGRTLPIAVTEVNSNWSNRQGKAATPDSAVNAVWWADALGRMIQNHVEMVAQFSLEGAGGLGLLAYPQPHPTYYVYTLYQKFGQELLYASSDDPQLRIYAARRRDGALTLIVVNLHSKKVQKPIQIDGFASAGSAETWLLDGEHSAEMVGKVAVGDGNPLTFPAQSVSLIILPAG